MASRLFLKKFTVSSQRDYPHFRKLSLKTEGHGTSQICRLAPQEIAFSQLKVIFVCVSVCLFMHMCEGAHRGQRFCMP